MGLVKKNKDTTERRPVTSADFSPEQISKSIEYYKSLQPWRFKELNLTCPYTYSFIKALSVQGRADVNETIGNETTIKDSSIQEFYKKLPHFAATRRSMEARLSAVNSNKGRGRKNDWKDNTLYLGRTGNFQGVPSRVKTNIKLIFNDEHITKEQKSFLRSCIDSGGLTLRILILNDQVYYDSSYCFINELFSDCLKVNADASNNNFIKDYIINLLGSDVFSNGLEVAANYIEKDDSTQDNFNWESDISGVEYMADICKNQINTLMINHSEYIPMLRTGEKEIYIKGVTLKVPDNLRGMISMLAPDTDMYIHFDIITCYDENGFSKLEPSMLKDLLYNTMSDHFTTLEKEEIDSISKYLNVLSMLQIVDLYTDVATYWLSNIDTLNNLQKIGSIAFNEQNKLHFIEKINSSRATPRTIDLNVNGETVGRLNKNRNTIFAMAVNSDTIMQSPIPLYKTRMHSTKYIRELLKTKVNGTTNRVNFSDKQIKELCRTPHFDKWFNTTTTTGEYRFIKSFDKEPSARSGYEILATPKNEVPPSANIEAYTANPVRLYENDKYYSTDSSKMYTGNDGIYLQIIRGLSEKAVSDEITEDNLNTLKEMTTYIMELLNHTEDKDSYNPVIRLLRNIGFGENKENIINTDGTESSRQFTAVAELSNNSFIIPNYEAICESYVGKDIIPLKI